MQCDALILCGGRAVRMGGCDKGLMLLDGRPLVEHVLQQLRAWPIGQIMLSANRNLPTYRSYGYPVLTDQRDDFPGPMAGIEAGLRYTQAAALLVVPCDVPRLPADLLPQLADVVSATEPVAYAVDAARDHPAICLVHRSQLGELQTRLKQGQRGLWRWQQSVGGRAIAFDFPFLNLNTLEALEAYGLHTHE